jgi:hypothetical protein
VSVIRSVKVADLVQGQVILAAHDPADGSLHWLRGTHMVPASQVIVGLTVEANDAEPWTAEPARTEGGTYVFAKPPQHRLRLLFEGSPRLVRPRADVYVQVLGTHHEVCGDCGEIWPCRDKRIDYEAQELAHKLADVCDWCGKPIGSAWSVHFFDGQKPARYHQAKKYRANGKLCRVASEEAQEAARQAFMDAELRRMAEGGGPA